MPSILVATREGLHRFGAAGEPRGVDHAGRSVGALGRAGAELLAILDGTELWRTEDGTWSHAADLDGHRGTCVAGIRGGVFVGSSEARLFRLAGESLEPVAAFDHAPGREAWFTPWGGPPDTRSMANWDEDVYVNVHVGGILRTEDAGRTWAPTIDIEADVHHVTTAEGLVLAACAGGLAVSPDRGATWTYRTEGLEARYARAVAVCGDAVLASASRGPRGGRSAVYRAPLGGGALERCRDGLPEWFDDNVDTYCLDALPDGSLAAFGTHDGRLFGSTDQGASWGELVTGMPAIGRVLVLEDLGSSAD